jgi:hypothetical protein
MALIHKFTKGRDNERGLKLKDGDTPYTHEQYQALTGYTVELKARSGAVESFESTDHPEMVRYDAGDVKLTVELGDLAAPGGEYQARLIGYSVDQPDGVTLIDFADYTVVIEEYVEVITGLVQSVDEEVTLASDGFADLEATDLVEMDLCIGPDEAGAEKKRLTTAGGHFEVRANETPKKLVLKLSGEETRLWDLKTPPRDLADPSVPEQVLWGRPNITYDDGGVRRDRMASGEFEIRLAMIANPTRGAVNA